MLDDLLKNIQRGLTDALSVRMAVTFMVLAFVFLWALFQAPVQPFKWARGFLGIQRTTSG